MTRINSLLAYSRLSRLRQKENSWDGCNVKKLDRSWYGYMFDVCGLGRFNRFTDRKVFITHLHEDHLPAAEFIVGARLKFYTGGDYVEVLREKYKPYGIPVEEYTDVVKLDHTFIYGRVRSTKTYGFFVKDSIIIPECDNPEILIREYKPKMAFIFVFHQSHNHLVGFNNGRNDIFLLDPRVWSPYKPNVIPKIVPSLSPEDQQYIKHLRILQSNGKR